MSDANEKIGTFVRVHWSFGGFNDFPANTHAFFRRCVADPEGAETLGRTISEYEDSLTIDTETGFPVTFKPEYVWAVSLSVPEARAESFVRDALFEKMERDLTPEDFE